MSTDTKQKTTHEWNDSDKSSLRQATSEAEREAEYIVRVYKRTDSEQMRKIAGRQKQ